MLFRNWFQNLVFACSNVMLRILCVVLVYLLVEFLQVWDDMSSNPRILLSKLIKLLSI